MEKTFGEKLRELRYKADISLRELARNMDVSAPFLSDVERGHRYPSDKLLANLARYFQVSVNELKRYDNRPPIAEIRKLADEDPRVGFAFRTALDDVRTGKITTDELLNRIRGRKTQK
jgi:transcriptional regulator with XRE-family HTH domain